MRPYPKVFTGGLPASLTENELGQFFRENYGNVRLCLMLLALKQLFGKNHLFRNIAKSIVFTAKGVVISKVSIMGSSDSYLNRSSNRGDCLFVVSYPDQN